ncbi:uncharacterized protein V6R79_012682 [Siganus canaliculatus]
MERDNEPDLPDTVSILSTGEEPVLLWKIITREKNVTESQAATGQSSLAPPVSVKGSFALDEWRSLPPFTI